MSEAVSPVGRLRRRRATQFVHLELFLRRSAIDHMMPVENSQSGPPASTMNTYQHRQSVSFFEPEARLEENLTITPRYVKLPFAKASDLVSRRLDTDNRRSGAIHRRKRSRRRILRRGGKLRLGEGGPVHRLHQHQRDASELPRAAPEAGEGATPTSLPRRCSATNLCTCGQSPTRMFQGMRPRHFRSSRDSARRGSV